jgi:hypothetical protein
MLGLDVVFGTDGDPVGPTSRTSSNWGGDVHGLHRVVVFDAINDGINRDSADVGPVQTNAEQQVRKVRLNLGEVICG